MWHLVSCILLLICSKASEEQQWLTVSDTYSVNKDTHRGTTDVPGSASHYYAYQTIEQDLIVQIYSCTTGLPSYELSCFTFTFLLILHHYNKPPVKTYICTHDLKT